MIKNKTGAFTCTLMLAVTHTSVAQLVIYDKNNQKGTSKELSVDKPYAGNSIPNSLNNKVESIKLKKGYGCVIAANFAGNGYGKFYQAKTGEKKINLPWKLKNKASFFRVVKLDTGLKKKGYAGNNPTLAETLKVSWNYRWSDGGSQNDGDFEYVPMKWGGSNPTGFANKWDSKAAACMLAFNEPDNSAQANIGVSSAVDKYEDLLPCGLCMGSPVVEQDSYKTWLADFMDDCDSKDLRVDFLAAHWYDWGNQNQTNHNNGQKIADRLKSKMINFRKEVGGNKMAVWLTEYNANPNRSSQNDHANFIKKSATWMNNTGWMQRYSYFENGGGKFTNNSGNLTTSGKAFRDLPNKDAGYGGTNNLDL